MKKLCIAIPNNPYNEGSFIQNQFVNLRPEFILYQGYKPYKDSVMGTIFKFPLNIEFIRKIISFLFPYIYTRLYEIALCDYFYNNKIDIVLANYGPVGANLTDACRKSGVELTVHFHGFDAYHYKTLAKYKYKYLKMFKYAKNIIAVSNHMMFKLESLGVIKNKLIKVPYGVDLDEFTYKKHLNSKNFLFIGRFVEKKNPIDIIMAFDLLISTITLDNKNLHIPHLTMIGDGPLLNECKRLVKYFGLKDNVTFLGHVPHLWIPSSISNSECLILNSSVSNTGDAEGLPNVILEACACGIPVIATNHTGIPDIIIDGYNGYLIEENNVSRLQLAMKAILDNPKKSKSMGKNGRVKVVDEFSIYNQMGELKRILK